MCAQCTLNFAINLLPRRAAAFNPSSARTSPTEFGVMGTKQTPLQANKYPKDTGYPNEFNEAKEANLANAKEAKGAAAHVSSAASASDASSNHGSCLSCPTP